MVSIEEAVKKQCRHERWANYGLYGRQCMSCGFKDHGYNMPQDSKPEQQLADSTNILAEAQSVIYGDREKTYGRPDKNLRLIASMWGTYLNTIVTVDDVCMMMVLMKVARLKNSPDHRDSQVDIAGYAALMERVQDYVQENKPNYPAPTASEVQHPGDSVKMRTEVPTGQSSNRLGDT